jgi:hypothetical protein
MRDAAMVLGVQCGHGHVRHWRARCSESGHGGCAPRGASLYPPRSGEELGRRFLGLPADLDAKARGDNSMPEAWRACPGVRGVASRDPRDMAKAGLLDT